MKENDSYKSEAYKQYISGVFSRASSDYDHVGPKFFSVIGRKLVDFADIPEGAHVLDVACGRGAVLFPAAASVSASGQVVGIDIAEGMIELMESEIARRGIDNVSVAQMDAESLKYEDASFDYVLCGLSLFFFPELERALDEFLRVLKPGGCLAVSTFETVEDGIEEQWEKINVSFKDHLAPPPPAQTKDLDSESEIRDTLSQAGFVGVEVATDQQRIEFKNEEEWWRWMWSHGFRGFLERLDSDYLDDYKEQALKFFLELNAEREIADTWHLLYTKAQKSRL